MMVKLGNEWDPLPKPEPVRNALQVAANVIILGMIAGGLIWGAGILATSYWPKNDGRPIKANYELPD